MSDPVPTGAWVEFAKAGGPAVVALVVVGGLLWKAASPYLKRLLDSLEALSNGIAELNVEIRVMSTRLDHLEREVRAGMPLPMAPREPVFTTGSAPPMDRTY